MNKAFKVLEGYAYFLIAIILTGFLFLYLKEILIPIFFSVILSVFLLPYVKFLQWLKIPNSLAIFISLLLFVWLLLMGFLWIYNRLLDFQGDYVTIQQKATSTFQQIRSFLKQNNYEGAIHINEKLEEIILKGSEMAGNLLLSLANFTGKLLLTIIYAFLILLYRGEFKQALIDLSEPAQHERNKHILSEAQYLLTQYMQGLLRIQILVFLFLLILLSISGLPHAFFIAFLGAFLNLVPYLGIFSVGFLAFIYSYLMFESVGYSIWIFGVFWIAHTIEANWITPKIMGKMMNINPLAAIIFIVLIGSLWGIIGMIIALPLLAIIRIIIENSSLNPLANLIKA